MIEGHLLEAEVRRGHRRLLQQVAPEHGIGGQRHPVLRVEVRQEDHALDGGQLAENLLHLGLAVELLAAVLIAVDADQDLGGELRVAVEHPARAEVRSAAGPDGTDAGRRQHRDHGLRDVGKIRHDALAGLHAEFAKLGGEDTHLAPELFPRHARERHALVEEHERVGVRPLVAQGMLRIVQPRAGKPFCARHAALGEHGAVRRRRLDPEIVPQRLPERLELFDRPTPQILVRRELEAALPAQPPQVRRDVGPLDPFRARRPQQITLFQHRDRLPRARSRAHHRNHRNHRHQRP